MYGNTFLNQHSSAGHSVTESPNIFNLASPNVPSNSDTYRFRIFYSPTNPTTCTPVPELSTPISATHIPTKPFTSVLSNSTTSSPCSESPLSTEALLDSNSQDSLMKLHQGGHFGKRLRPGELIWELECPSCKQWVRTSIGHAVPDAFVVQGHFVALAPREALHPVRSHSNIALATTTPAHASLWTASTPTPLSRPANRENVIPSAQSQPDTPMHANNHILHICAPTPLRAHDRLNSCHCIGVLLDWDVQHGPFQDNFPWSRPQDGPDSLPFHVLMTDVDVRARSKHCTGMVAFREQQCDQCTLVIPRIAELAEIATFAKPHTKHYMLTPYQLWELLDVSKETINTL
ncbi:hypothetical protein BV22DRAFT_1134275 [Leucogyrophana mollusca]|uniref:Uncharacterized protein n=1 Tax=Leucogyrophana mollusca TaxID=85980 RepID=A0ACB8B201_9AGAM|nr:hypothetical protein BV22DRAFT_1134275 [Leucogyrophana mollusca]